MRVFLGCWGGGSGREETGRRGAEGTRGEGRKGEGRGGEGRGGEGCEWVSGPPSFAWYSVFSLTIHIPVVSRRARQFVLHFGCVCEEREVVGVIAVRRQAVKNRQKRIRPIHARSGFLPQVDLVTFCLTSKWRASRRSSCSPRSRDMSDSLLLK